MARLITRYTIIEKFYLQIPSESIAELTKDLVSLYTAILEYFGEAKKYYGKGTASMPRVVQFTSEEITERL